MNYGLYLSASGVLTNLYRQDVFANNLVNAQTVGFKPDMPTVLARDSESVEDNFGGELSNELLDRLGGGVMAGPQRIAFAKGSLQQTENPTDVALNDKEQFFAVSAMDRDSGEQKVFLTRDGRFHRRSDGYLAMIAGNHMVLDADDQPIELGPGLVEIDGAGQVKLNNEVVSQLQVTTIKDKSALSKFGQGLFKINGPDTLREVVDSPSVEPGFVESSAADPIKTLLQLTAATKAVSANGNMIRYHDLVMDRAVNVLGRVVA